MLASFLPGIAVRPTPQSRTWVSVPTDGGNFMIAWHKPTVMCPRDLIHDYTCIQTRFIESIKLCYCSPMPKVDILVAPCIGLDLVAPGETPGIVPQASVNVFGRHRLLQGCRKSQQISKSLLEVLYLRSLMGIVRLRELDHTARHSPLTQSEQTSFVVQWAWRREAKWFSRQVFAWFIFPVFNRQASHAAV